MAQSDSSTFFDVLIDRLVDDVRREFEASREPVVAATTPVEDDFSEKKPVRAVAFDDLVSKMIGFRARLATPEALPAVSRYAPAAKFQTDDVKNQMSQATPKEAKPRFASAEAEIAFTLVSKSGAKFYAADQDESGLTREALKRERRRVLLTLHPDRHPESDRARAHQNFLEAAEAFSVLAEDAVATSRAA